MASTPSLPKHYIGLMSGTSLDGVDGVLCHFDTGQPTVVGHVSLPFSPELKSELLSLNQAGANELRRAALAANALARTYVAAVARLLAQGGLPTSAVHAIGAHGQTVRHQPGLHDGTGYTLQLNNPALVAEHTGIDVVADFRSRDVAAGGQGAPLVPAFHRALFGQPNDTVLVLNIGGIANLSVLPASGPVVGFDCGPGNALMDHWCELHTGHPYDNRGAWAASGHVLPGLLSRLMSEPFLALQPPKSTGRDLFNPAWLQRCLQEAPPARPVDIQATLTQFTAQACIDDVRRHGKGARRLLVCGGGALNQHLMDLLQAGLPELVVETTEAHGLPATQVEATAFAWLARRFMHRLPGNLPHVTGAEGPRILGALYPA